MVLNKFFLLFISLTLFCSTAFASQVAKAFKAKNYSQVLEIYRKSKAKNFSDKELVMISISMKKKKLYRQDIKINSLLVKRKFLKPHKKILKEIRAKNSLDSDAYPKTLKLLYWNIYTDYAGIIKEYTTDSAALKKDLKNFEFYKTIVSDLEIKEDSADKVNSSISKHIEGMKENTFKLTKSFNISYLSWQRIGNAKNAAAGQSADLVVTNTGFCIGGDIGYEKSNFHYYVDGCLLIGNGIVRPDRGGTLDRYDQETPVYGLKVAPGASWIVSSLRSRIGFRIPIMISMQDITEAPGYTVEKPAMISAVPSLYSRWQYENWYIQTEFGKFITEKATLWSLGIGRTF